MDKEIVLKYIGKKVEIWLKNNLKYSGKIIKIKGETVLFLDKFNKEVPFECGFIEHINEVNSNV